MVGKMDPQGSKWHRWDPHIHAPGTVLEDRFAGDWEGYLTAIESSNPPIRALGITNYCLVDSYEAVLDRRKSGRLQNVELIFPNIELRYDIGVPKGSAINVHLLVCPDDTDHLEQIKRFLASLTFSVNGEEFCCDRTSLIRLGQVHDPSTKGNEKVALANGVKQFKVNRELLHEKLKMNKWAQENVLTAISVSSVDGTAGLQGDDSFTSVRRDIEKTAKIVFSSQENQRLFWLGRGVVTGAEFVERYGGPKPCIHGDDAHEVARVGRPDQDRYTWIKGDLIFESLRQICFEPGTRVIVGPSYPAGALSSQTIASVRLTNAPWLKNGDVSLNSGLIGIIGARGSGKTALADIIAAGGFALAGHLSDRSFVHRAEEHLGGSTAILDWEDEDRTSCEVRAVEDRDFLEEPRVQYLSQQFVDILCSSEGITDKLLAEIKRVVFDAHSTETRMGATSFDELLDIRTTRARTMRANHEAALQDTIGQLLTEWSRGASLKNLKLRRDELAKGVEKDKQDRAKSIGKGDDERVKQMDAVSRVIEAINRRLQQDNRKLQSLFGLRDEVANVRKNAAPLRLSQLRQNYAEAALNSDEWDAFSLRFTGAVDDILASRIRQTEDAIKVLSGPKPGEAVPPPAGEPIPTEPYIKAGEVLEQQTLSVLRKEAERLRALIGIDVRNAGTVRRLSEKISKDESTLAQIDRDVAAAEESPKRMAELNATRQAAYAAVFESIADEEKQLADLYAPLGDRLKAEHGALGKLSFSVRRWVNLAEWERRGEELFDLRVNGAFAGRGVVIQRTKAELLPAWLSGSSAQVAEAVGSFRLKYEAGMITQTIVDRKDPFAFRKWWSDVASWLWGTDHISVTYSIQYDGADVEQLSPGTRGIVLLLLYLAIDSSDDRPLIIDQPEENLDPKSIHDELVEHFRSAKRRRQIIVVTHNANIVVNADADQVIVAECGPHQPGRLPDISYTGGGLENSAIRKQVCDILEGGEAAFRERARRLRIRA